MPETRRIISGQNHPSAPLPPEGLSHDAVRDLTEEFYRRTMPHRTHKYQYEDDNEYGNPREEGVGIDTFLQPVFPKGSLPS